MRPGGSILGHIRASRLLHVIACAPVAAILAASIAPSVHARAATAAATLRPFLVALDAGHGGSPDNANPGKAYDSGAVAANGLEEKDLALDEVMRVKRMLEAQGAQVLLTRSTDVFMDITPRMQAALDAGADLFVSIHFNGYADTSAAGSLVLYPKDFCQPFAARLAEAMARRLSPYGVLPDGLQYRPEMFQHAAMPTGTIEPLYLTNPDEAALMTREDVRNAIAQSVVDAVDGQAGPEIAERHALSAAWAAVSPILGPAATGADAAVAGATPTAAPSLLPGSENVAADGIIPLTPQASSGATAATSSSPGTGAAAGVAGSAPSPAAAGASAARAGSPVATPGSSRPWALIALLVVAMALLAVLRRAGPVARARRALLHGLAVVSAAILRVIARLDGAEVPAILRFETRSKRRIARRRALLERSRRRGGGDAG
ncbi:MAG TPA: N-acetylmuramoyl-L-alanine amidase, partial [Candidatus Dormibacteraeota bacterium]|nr:N-acetylmuramoyl-L-alanine amidase [Candidatus Dormibacteraeota bacterium]